jgi:ribosomal protein S18 acetylase RimI-like enzyme
MSDVPVTWLADLADPIWLALNLPHRHLSLHRGQARRYRAEVAPFAAVEENTEAAMSDLRELLQPGEAVYLAGEPPAAASGLRYGGAVPCLQMLFPLDSEVPQTPPGPEVIVPLDCTNAGEMMDLIAIAYPGYFRAQTCRMGEYYGVRDDEGTLIAMGGERLVFGSEGLVYREISGLCSHPQHAGRGLGTQLLLHLLRKQREAGAVSWLYVLESNRRAIHLYRRIGFVTVQRVELHQLIRED